MYRAFVKLAGKGGRGNGVNRLQYFLKKMALIKEVLDEFFAAVAKLNARPRNV